MEIKPKSPSQSPTRQVSSPQDDTVKSGSTSTKTTSKYVRDFESLFVPINITKLRYKAQNGNLRQCQFRSLCWRYFLQCLPEHCDDWLHACKNSRNKYIEISKKHLGSIKSEATIGDNDDKRAPEHQSVQRGQRPETIDKKSGNETSDDEIGRAHV